MNEEHETKKSFDHKEILVEFIETYQSHPELWDTNHKNYSNRAKKAKAYDTLIETLKKIDPSSTRDTVVRKINTLRCNFRKEFRKVENSKKSGVGAKEIYEPSLWYYNKFQFLVNHYNDILPENRSTCTTTSAKDLVTEQLNDDSSGACAIEESNENTYLQYSHTIKKKKKKPSVDASEMFAYVVKHLDQEDDEFLTMAKGYAQKLRKMKPLQRLYADKLINEVLLEGQLKGLKRHSSLTNVESSSNVQCTTEEYFNRSAFEQEESSESNCVGTSSDRPPVCLNL